MGMMGLLKFSKRLEIAKLTIAKLNETADKQSETIMKLSKELEEAHEIIEQQDKTVTELTEALNKAATLLNKERERQ